MVTKSTQKNSPKETKEKTKKVLAKKSVSKEVSKEIESSIYNQNGKEVGKIKLPESIFNLPWNADLVHQVIVGMESNKRAGTAHTKGRAEVRGGGKKPWRQKGTGRARHGSSRSPIWRGGGITHGPRNDKNYTHKINKKAKNKALYTILSRKFKDNEVLFMDSISISSPKTKTAKEILANLSSIKGMDYINKKRNNSLLLAIDKKNSSVEKSFRNFGNVEVSESRNLNPLSLAKFKYVAIVNPGDYISKATANK